ncbi:MATE family efflux transporter [Aquimarina sp. I32.4]|uniref:MATE family efflux transporter n=1 Tax=Aquimarina sp. I32.4 TaxID=2053903 RepID=UPI000CDEA413|nr:MATE family efflux transporter [Aquimarina sp. I32.4]
MFKNFFSPKHTYNILVLAFPIMLSHVGNMLVGVVDTIMVGDLGVNELAAISLANAVFHLATILGVGVSMGLTPLIIKYSTDKNEMKKEDQESYYFNSLFINILTGIVLFIVLVIFGKFSYLFNQPEEILDLTENYLQIAGLSLVPLLFFQTARQHLEALEYTKVALYYGIISNLINVLLNYILIYGKFGFPQYGLEGAATATLIARCVLAILITFYFVKIVPVSFFDLSFKKHFSSKKIKELLNMGLPIGTHFALEYGAFSFAWLMTGWISSVALSSFQIAINLSGITYTVAIGLAAAVTVKYGKQYSLRNRLEMKKVGISSFVINIAIMSLFALVFIVFRDILPKLYIKDIEVVELTSSLLLIAAVFQISDGLQVNTLGLLRGIEDVKIPTMITLISYWVIAMPVSYILAFHKNMGAQGVWIGLLTGLTFSAIALIYRLIYATNAKLSLEPSR